MKDAKRTVALSLVGTTVLVTVDSLVKRKSLPPPRAYVGPLVAYTMLAFLAEPAPQVAAPLAVLVLLSVLLAKGESLGRFVTSGKGKS